jgi:hypothetical protein
MKDEYDENDFRHAVRGAVFPMPPGYTQITIRMDDEILEWFRATVHRAGGGNYQRLMNDALREHIRQRETMEEMLRRVVREELGRTAAMTGAGTRSSRVRRIGALRRLGSERRL